MGESKITTPKKEERLVLDLTGAPFSPAFNYPENVTYHSDIRVASLVAREWWETHKRMHGQTGNYPVTWEERHDEDKRIDIKVFQELLNRRIIH